MPVMEGKAVLFKQFAGIDAYPICVDAAHGRRAASPSARRWRRRSAASTWRTSPRRRASRSSAGCRTSLDIPVFHDDQHGTAIVVLAAALNAARVVGKRLAEMTITVVGTGAAGCGRAPSCSPRSASATSSASTARASSTAALTRPVARPSGGSPSTATVTAAPAASTTPSRAPTSCSGCPGRASSSRGARRHGRRRRSCSRWRTRSRRSCPARCPPNVAVVATGRSDFPNQINNVLAFPGVFRGLLDSGAPPVHDGDEAGRRRRPGGAGARPDRRPHHARRLRSRRRRRPSPAPSAPTTSADRRSEGGQLGGHVGGGAGGPASAGRRRGVERVAGEQVAQDLAATDAPCRRRRRGRTRCAPP